MAHQKDLESILQEVGAVVDQDPATPSGDDLTVQVKYAALALEEWGNAYQWKQLKVQHDLGFTLSGTSIGLPGNFKDFMSPMYEHSPGLDAADEYQVIPPEGRFRKHSTDKYLVLMGDDLRGRWLKINPAMKSGFSGVMDLQVYPSAMATLADICVCPNPEFIVRRTAAFILESRSDPRFPLMKAEADKLLARMIEEEDAPSLAETNRIKEWPIEDGFVLGEED